MPSFAASHYLGQALLGEARLTTQLGIPHSRAFFCATCGEIWYRIWVEGGLWVVEHAPCENHVGKLPQDQERVPGSVLSTIPVGSPSYAAHIDFAPSEVLRREFEITLRYFEKELVS